MSSETSDSVPIAEEQHLVDAYVATGDQRAFSEIVRRYEGMVHRVCARVLGNNRTLAQDAAQTVFFVLSRRASAPRVRSNMAGWLHRTATHTALHMLRSEVRRRGRENVTCLDSDSAIRTPGDARWEEMRGLLDEAIEALPEGTRQTVLARYVVGEPVEGTVERLGVSRQTVHNRLRKGVDAIRRHLRRQGFAVSSVSLVTMLDAEIARSADADLCAVNTNDWEDGSPISKVGEAVIAEMDRMATATAWARVGMAVVGGILVGAVTVLVANRLQPKVTDSTSWRVGSVQGNALVRQGTRTRVVVPNDLLVPGDTILTSSNEEVVAVSSTGDRFLLREAGELSFEDVVPSAKRASFMLRGGAASVKAEQPVRIRSPHASLDVAGGCSLFLVVESGDRFTRIDVTKGAVEVSPTPTGLVNNTSVPAGMAICLGLGTGPQVHKSDCREFSPKRGGCFFRDAVAAYEKGTTVLDNLIVVPDPPIESLTSRDIKKAVESVHGGDTSDARWLTGMKQTIRVNVGVATGSTDVVELPLPFTSRVDAAEASVVLVFRTHLKRLDYSLKGCDDYDPPGGERLQQAETNPTATVVPGTPVRLSIRFVCVGRDTTGLAVMEVQSSLDGNELRRKWKTGDFRGMIINAPGTTAIEFGQATLLSLKHRTVSTSTEEKR